MNILNNYKSILQQADETVRGLLTKSGEEEYVQKKAQFEKLLERSKYVKVPLVGVFSAGKSSILNMFTERLGVLPIDTMPETAVAAELYFDENERVEHYRDGQPLSTVGVMEIKSLDTEPGDILYVYLNSQPVKRLQDKGIVLVDMPGIGSGFEQHDAAIMNYIEFGTAFILMVDIAQGTLRDSTLTFVEELKRYGLTPAVLVSKIDKDRSSVGDVIETVKYDMSQVSGEKDPYVASVCAVDRSLEGLTNYLDSLDAEGLLKKKVGGTLVGIINSLQIDLNMQIEDKNKSIEQAQEELKKIEEELSNVKEELPTDVNTKSVETCCHEIMENIELALRDKSGEIARMVVDGTNEETIKSTLNSIVRAELVTSLQEQTSNYASTLGVSVNDALDRIAHINIDTNKFEMPISVEYIIQIVAALFGKGSITKFVSKWLPILFKPLTALINFFMEDSTEEKIRKVKEKINNEGIRDVTNALRPDVLQLVQESRGNVYESMKNEVETAVNKKKDSLKAKLSDAQASKAEVDAQISALTEANNKLETIKKDI